MIHRPNKESHCGAKPGSECRMGHEMTYSNPASSPTNHPGVRVRFGQNNRGYPSWQDSTGGRRREAPLPANAGVNAFLGNPRMGKP